MNLFLKLCSGVCVIVVFCWPSKAEASCSNFVILTPYNTSSPTNWTQVLQPLEPTCSLSHVNVVARHGTSWPKDKLEKSVGEIVADFAKLVNRTNETMVTYLLKKVANWKSQNEHPGDLAKKGVDEQQFLAQDFYRLFKKYKLSRGKLKFTSSDSSKAITSSTTFREKWLDVSEPDGCSYLPRENAIDVDHLSFHDRCHRFTRETKNNKTSRLQFEKISNSTFAQEIIATINNRLFNNVSNFPSDSLINWDKMWNLYLMAGFENAIFGSSVFNQLFNTSELAFLDFASDLEDYWMYGYANQLSTNISCVLTSEIFREASARQFIGVFQFTKFTDFLPLFSTFDLFNDSSEIFSANAHRCQRNIRKYRSSHVIPFSANMAFLFFDCQGNATAGELPGQKLAIVVNGQLQLLTDLNSLRTNKPSAFTCNFAALCSKAPSPTNRRTFIFLILGSITAFLVPRRVFY